MGEAKPEEAKAETKAEEEKKEEKKEGKEEEKKEEKKEEEKAEEKKEEEKKEEEAKPPPPPPIVILSIDMHCVGCAKKIERCLLKCKGVEEVESDMAKNQVKIKGVVDPQALCSRIQQKTMRSARVISPLPPPDEAESPKPQVVASQVSGVTTVELHVNMHCEACAQQLRRKILKMRGVQTAETELSSGKVAVTGTMTGEKLVHYIYRRTGKLAKVIPPPPPPPPPPAEEEKKDEPEKKPGEEKPAEEKKEEKPEKGEEGKAPPADAPAAEEKKEEGKKEEGEEAKKETEGMQFMGPEDMVKRMMYWNGGYNNYGFHEDEFAKRMVMPPWMINFGFIEELIINLLQLGWWSSCAWGAGHGLPDERGTVLGFTWDWARNLSLVKQKWDKTVRVGGLFSFPTAI
ncbi:heavy metal-associated isoprenylated plant protein 9-like [Asparagus officinalis]|uniref:heavy metal-associated isoprenylated plant protein 9-like n=1 Tax=Asparagus officinalis TaxID=4686 RepID=UPI00098E35A7|nr:heavy metal-associated isoprenylated plant protein 9-like [Asparagus officinalis]